MNTLVLEEVLNGEIALAALVKEALVFLIPYRVLHDILNWRICLSDGGPLVKRQWNRHLGRSGLQAEVVLSVISALLFSVVGIY